MKEKDLLQKKIYKKKNINTITKNSVKLETNAQSQKEEQKKKKRINKKLSEEVKKIPKLFMYTVNPRQL